VWRGWGKGVVRDQEGERRMVVWVRERREGGMVAGRGESGVTGEM